MDDSQDILLDSLRNSGVSIPPGLSAIQDLTPAMLFSICSQSLCLIDKTLSFPTSLPEDSMADRFKICSDLASAFKNLGFIDDVDFHKFLYPSEEDLYKLVRFLVGRLAESSDVQKAINEKETREVTPQLKEMRLQTEAAESTNLSSGDSLFGESNKSNSILGISVSDEDGGLEKYRAGAGVSDEEEWMSGRVDQASLDKVDVAGANASGNEETVAFGFNEHLNKQVKNLTSLQELSSDQKLLLDLISKSSKLQHLQYGTELLKAAIALENELPVDFCRRQLNDLMEARRDKLMKLDSQWSALRRSTEQKRTSLEEAFCATKPEAREKHQRKKEFGREIESVSAEMKSREDEFSLLSVELGKQPTVALRGSFVLRIKEITKNSRKQDADIERILRETRELQLESNSIQERLNRTYAVVDETIFREARKDPVAQQAYRLLTRIHECFEQTAEKVLLTDRTRREVADYEAKLASMASRSLNSDKLQADLDAIRKENDILEQNLKSC